MDNLLEQIDAHNEKQIGKCPVCGNYDLDVKFETRDKKCVFNTLELICNSCGNNGIAEFAVVVIDIVKWD